MLAFLADVQLRNFGLRARMRRRKKKLILCIPTRKMPNAWRNRFHIFQRLKNNVEKPTSNVTLYFFFQIYFELFYFFFFTPLARDARRDQKIIIKIKTCTRTHTHTLSYAYIHVNFFTLSPLRSAALSKPHTARSRPPALGRTG